jgi:NADH dehydrogenase
VKITGADAKALKKQINTEWIYPLSADRAELHALADPRRIMKMPLSPSPKSGFQ